MKAISIHQPHVRNIMLGTKTAENRKTNTTHRGDLLICSTKKQFGDPAKYPLGMAMCIVDLYDVEKADETHRRQIYPDPDQPQSTKISGYIWKIRNVRVIDPFPVKGQQGFYYVDLPHDADPEPIVKDPRIIGVFQIFTWIVFIAFILFFLFKLLA